jgi:hypothetical protein
MFAQSSLENRHKVHPFVQREWFDGLDYITECLHLIMSAIAQEHWFPLLILGLLVTGIFAVAFVVIHRAIFRCVHRIQQIEKLVNKFAGRESEPLLDWESRWWDRDWLIARQAENLIVDSLRTIWPHPKKPHRSHKLMRAIRLPISCDSWLVFQGRLRF